MKVSPNPYSEQEMVKRAKEKKELKKQKQEKRDKKKKEKDDKKKKAKEAQGSEVQPDAAQPGENEKIPVKTPVKGGGTTRKAGGKKQGQAKNNTNAKRKTVNKEPQEIPRTDSTQANAGD